MSVPSTASACVYCGDRYQGTGNILYTSSFKNKAVLWHCGRRYDDAACRTQRLDKGKRQSLPCKGLVKPARNRRKRGTKSRSASRDDTRPASRKAPVPSGRCTAGQASLSGPDALLNRPANSQLCYPGFLLGHKEKIVRLDPCKPLELSNMAPTFPYELTHRCCSQYVPQ